MVLRRLEELVHSDDVFVLGFGEDGALRLEQFLALTAQLQFLFADLTGPKVTYLMATSKLFLSVARNTLPN